MVFSCIHKISIESIWINGHRGYATGMDLGSVADRIDPLPITDHRLCRGLPFGIFNQATGLEHGDVPPMAAQQDF